jgi:hypothetical protein
MKSMKLTPKTIRLVRMLANEAAAELRRSRAARSQERQWCLSYYAAGLARAAKLVAKEGA